MIAEYGQIIDGHEYHTGDEIWDLGSWVTVDVFAGSCRKYIGLSADVAKLPHYVSAGSIALCLDTGDWYIYLKSTDSWYKPWATSTFSAAKGSVECADYTVTSTDVTEESGLKTKVLEIITGLSTGVTVTEDDITVVSFVAAVDGDGDNVDGTDGKFSCLVAMKDATAGSSIANVNGVIKAKKFAGTPNVEAVATAKGLIENGAYTIAQKDAETQQKLKAKLASVIGELEGMSATAVSVTESNISVNPFVAAVAGDADYAEGTNGSFGFTVNLTKGKASETTTSISGEITATAYAGKTNASAVSEAKSLIEAGPYKIAQASADTKEKAKTAVVAAINALSGMDATGITIKDSDVTMTQFVAATAGDVDNASGTNGSFRCTVAIAKGKSSDTAIISSGVITATAFSGLSNETAVANAKSAIEGGTYTFTQDAVNTQDALPAKLVTVINALDGMSATGITITAENITVGTFTAAKKGTFDNTAGTNGSFIFTVAITKGSHSQTTEGVSGTITATAYDGPPIGASAVSVASEADFGACGKAQDWMSDVSIEWEGANGHVSGTFNKAKTGTTAGTYQFAMQLDEYFADKSVDVALTAHTTWENTTMGHIQLSKDEKGFIEVKLAETLIAKLDFTKATFNEGEEA